MEFKTASPGIKTSQMTNHGKIKNRLHFAKQFEDLNKRIQSFQDKNQSIINRIKEAYNFKKTAAHNIQVYIPTTEHAVQYETKNGKFTAEEPQIQDTQEYNINLNRISSESQIKNSSHQDVVSQVDQMTNSLKHQYEISQQIPLKHLNIRPSEPTGTIYTSPYHKKVQTDGKFNGHQIRRMKQSTQEVESNYVNQQNQPIVNLQYFVRKSFLQQGSQNDMKISYLQEKVNRTVLENNDLLQLLQKKEEELHYYKNVEIKFKAYSNSIKRVIEESLQNFQEEFLLSKLTEVRKHVKKCENKVKKLTLRVNDVAEERRSRQVIQTSRTQRSQQQRRRRESRNKSVCTSFITEQKQKNRIELIPSRYSDSRSSNKFKSANEHQLQTIAVNYEQMIKNKTEQNQKYENLLRSEKRKKEQLQQSIKQLTETILQKDKLIKQLRVIQQAKHEDNETLEEEIKNLMIKLQMAEQELKKQFVKEKQMQEVLTRLQKSKRQQEEDYLFKSQSLMSSHNSITQQLNRKLGQYQISNNEKSSEIKEARDKFMEVQKRYMQKECQIFALNNKIKKLEGECMMKEQKLDQLEELLLKNSDSQMDKKETAWPDLTFSTHIRGMQQNLRSATDQLQQKNVIINELSNKKKQMDLICRGKDQKILKATENIKALQAQIEWLENQMQKVTNQSNQRSIDKEKAAKSELLEEELQKNRELIQKLYKDNTSIREELQKVKEENLMNNRELIRVSSECSYSKDQVANYEIKLERVREEKNELKKKIRELQKSIEQAAQNHIAEVQKYINEAQDLRQTIQQLQFRKQQKQDPLMASFAKVSKLSTDNLNRQRCKTDHNIAYKIKNDVPNCDQYQYITEEDIYNEKNVNIMLVQSKVQVQIQSKMENTYSIVAPEPMINLYQQKIKTLQTDLQKGKQRQHQLSEIMHQLFQNTKSMEDENKKLLLQMKEKQNIILQLKNMLQQKQNQLENVANKNIYRQILDQDNQKQRQNKDNERSPVKDTHLSFKLSLDYSEDNNYDLEMSCLSNISDIFKRDDLLERTIKNGKTSREEQVLLYSKTSAYIKSLKETIEAKQKRIKLLQKQISNIKSQQNSRWSFKDKDRSSSQKANFSDEEVLLDDIEQCDQYKDYDSVQLDIRRSKYYEMVKQLQHQKNLITEQNKMLIKQMQVLQNQLQKAQEQQSTLIKIKELYKEEIKRMIEKAEKQEHQLEEKIKQLEKNIEQSESHHNLEALKQLFFKIIEIIAYHYDPSCKAARKQQKRKQLEEYIKVMCSLLHLQIGIRDKLIESIRK